MGIHLTQVSPTGCGYRFAPLSPYRIITLRYGYWVEIPAQVILQTHLLRLYAIAGRADGKTCQEALPRPRKEESVEWSRPNILGLPESSGYPSLDFVGNIEIEGSLGYVSFRGFLKAS